MEDQNDLFVFDTEKEEASDLKHFLSTISSSLVSIDLNKSEEELCFGEYILIFGENITFCLL